MEGCALLLCFHFGLIRASSLRPKPKHNRTILHKVTILAKAINIDKPPVLWRTALQAEYQV